MKLLIAICLLLLLLTGCADTVSCDYAQKIEPVGFWYGFWHGIILPFSWIFAVCNDTYSIYAAYNNGNWYDFGFMLGTVSCVSSSQTKRRR